MLVQHMDEVPDTLPVTEETRERLRAQANQLGEPTVVRLIDLLAVAVDDMRQGGDPRLPLELALVKVTRPGCRSVARVGEPTGSSSSSSAGRSARPAPRSFRLRRPRDLRSRPRPRAAPPDVDLEQLQEAWSRTILPAVEERGGIPTASLLREAHPAQLAGNTLTVEFPASAGFHRSLAEDPRNATVLSDALYDVTGRRLALSFAVGEDADDEPAVEAGRPGRRGRDPRADEGDARREGNG